MWEIAIKSKFNNKVVQYIYKMMQEYIVDKSCVLTIYDNKKEIAILFACPFAKKDYYIEMIKMCISDYVINVYKYEYLIKHIDNFLQDETSFKSFIKLLSLYDKQVDIEALKDSIVLEEVFYIDSFLRFRLLPLIRHWEDLCDLAKDNFDCFISSESFLEIVRFLAGTLDETCSKLKLITKKGKYVGYRVSTGEVAEKLFECASPFGLVSHILKICPKTIDVFLDDSFDKGVDLLQSIFDNRLKIFYKN